MSVLSVLSVLSALAVLAVLAVLSVLSVLSVLLANQTQLTQGKMLILKLNIILLQTGMSMVNVQCTYSS